MIAVATSEEGRPLRLALMPVAAHTSDEIERIANAHLAPAARVVSNGLDCFRAATRAGCSHEPVNVSKTLAGKSEKLACFRWVNVMPVVCLQHDARQCEDRDHRHAQVRVPALCRPLSRLIPVPLQPPLRSAPDAGPACLRRCPRRPQALRRRYRPVRGWAIRASNVVLKAPWMGPFRVLLSPVVVSRAQ